MYPVKEVNVPFKITIDKIEGSELADYVVVPSNEVVELDSKIVATVTLLDYGVTVIEVVNEVVGLNTTVTVVGQKPVSKVEEKVDAARVELAEVSDKIDEVAKVIHIKLDMIEVGVQVTRVDVVTNVSRLADVLNRTVVYVRDNTLATDKRIVDLVAVIADKTEEIIEGIHALGGADDGDTVSDLIDKIDELDAALTDRLAGQTSELQLLDPAEKIELLSDKLGDSLVELKIKLDEQNEVMLEHTDSFAANKEAVSKVAKNVDDVETVVRGNAEQIDVVRKKINESSSVLGEVKDTGDLTRVDVAKTRDEMSGLSDLLHEVGDGLTDMTDTVTGSMTELTDSMSSISSKLGDSLVVDTIELFTQDVWTAGSSTYVCVRGPAEDVVNVYYKRKLEGWHDARLLGNLVDEDEVTFYEGNGKINNVGEYILFAKTKSGNSVAKEISVSRELTGNSIEILTSSIKNKEDSTIIIYGPDSSRYSDTKAYLKIGDEDYVECENPVEYINNGMYTVIVNADLANTVVMKVEDTNYGVVDIVTLHGNSASSTSNKFAADTNRKITKLVKTVDRLGI